MSQPQRNLMIDFLRFRLFILSSWIISNGLSGIKGNSVHRMGSLKSFKDFMEEESLITSPCTIVSSLVSSVYAHMMFSGYLPSVGCSYNRKACVMLVAQVMLKGQWHINYW